MAGIECDALVVVGDDQSEVFDASIQPAVGIYWGEEWRTTVLEDVPPGPFFENVKTGYAMDDIWTFQGASELALDLIKSTVEQGFDMTSLARMPEGRGFGHAYGFIIRRLLGERSVPVVPVLLNTYYAPNQPTAARCYQLGKALGRAVERSATGHKVLFAASGGLSHFVVNEKLDRGLLAAIAAGDEAALSSIPQELMQSGSSEIRTLKIQPSPYGSSLITLGSSTTALLIAVISPLTGEYRSLTDLVDSISPHGSPASTASPSEGCSSR